MGKAYSQQDMAAARSANASLRSRNAPRKSLLCVSFLPSPNPALGRLTPLSRAKLRSASACPRRHQSTQAEAPLRSPPARPAQSANASLRPAGGRAKKTCKANMPVAVLKHNIRYSHPTLLSSLRMPITRYYVKYLPPHGTASRGQQKRQQKRQRPIRPPRPMAA